MSTRAKVQAAATVAAILIMKKKKKKKPRKVWVREWISKRAEIGVEEQLLKDLQATDPRQLKNFLRMSLEDFNILLNLIQAKIAKKDTFMRRAISPTVRLLVTLRFLATGKCM